MTNPRSVVRSRRVVLPGEVRSASLHIDEGRIARIDEYEASCGGASDIDVGTLAVSPGIVDTHVHINDPGRANWEGFDHATRAAAAGGVTTIVDMPLNSVPPTTTVKGFEEKIIAAAWRCCVDVAFWGGVVPGNAAELEPLTTMGVLGFKCFLSPSGVDEFPHVTEADLREAMPALARLGMPLLAHAELPSRLIEPRPGAAPREYRTWLDTRPSESESAAIELLVALARETGAHVHIVHLAAADALKVLDAARRDGIPMSVETCPHYLTFSADAIPPGATSFKCAPPIRTSDHRERLWEALGSGGIDLVATDHSPAPPELKRLGDGDFLRAWGGIASLELGLRAVWTGAAVRGYRLSDVARWMSDAPARLAGLHGVKGEIAAGYDADLIVWDPDASDAVDASRLQQRHPVTPYDGMRLKGRIHKTFLRGEIVFDEGQFVPQRGRPIFGRIPSVKIAPR